MSLVPPSMAEPHRWAGYEANTPTEDTYLRRFVANWTAGIEAHGVPAGGRVLRHESLAAVDVGRPSFGANVATLTAPLDPPAVDELMAALDRFYGLSTGGFMGTVFLFSPGPTPDLGSHGWTLLGDEPLMLRLAGGSPPPAPDGLRVEGVRDEAALLAFEQAVVRGFESPDLGAQGPGAIFPSGILADARFRLWVGWEGTTPVCGASTFVANGINDVTIVATVPEARRRGYGAAVNWLATLADPDLLAMLLATDEGRPVYERMGYRPVSRWTVWSRERG